MKQGGCNATEYESYGQPGEKEPRPSAPASQASDDGNHETQGKPATPDNVSGSIESPGPTKAEGDLGVQDFPHRGAPPRTTSV